MQGVLLTLLLHGVVVVVHDRGQGATVVQIILQLLGSLPVSGREKAVNTVVNVSILLHARRQLEQVAVIVFDASTATSMILIVV